MLIKNSPTPVVLGSTAQQSVETENQETEQEKAQTALNVNENEPTTNIQVIRITFLTFTHVYSIYNWYEQQILF